MAFLPIFLLGFGLQFFLNLRWHASIYEADVARDVRLIARSLAPAFADVLEGEGPEQAMALVRAAGRSGEDPRVRWRELDRDGIPEGVDETRLRRGEHVARTGLPGEDGSRFYTYAPVRVGGRLVGVLEVSERLDEGHRFLYERLLRSALLALGLVAAFALTAFALGSRLVGRPVSALIAKSRRVASGDFSRPLRLRADDELGRLATEMNAMADQLEESEQRLHEEAEKRVETLQHLRHADRLTTIGKVASGIAHELGTPLNVVASRAKMISSGEASTAEEIVRNASAIHRQSERMAGIVRLLLDFARRPAPEKKRGELQSLAGETVDLLTPFAHSRGVHLHLEPRAAPLHADFDRVQLQQALTNLLVNAVHASPKEASVRVNVEEGVPESERRPFSRRRSYARIRVEDEGKGMPPDALKRAFDPFFTTKPTGEGTGLGLSVAQGIAEEHGGWIDAESHVERGSVFTLWMPL